MMEVVESKRLLIMIMLQDKAGGVTGILKGITECKAMV